MNKLTSLIIFLTLNLTVFVQADPCSLRRNYVLNDVRDRQELTIINGKEHKKGLVMSEGSSVTLNEELIGDFRMEFIFYNSVTNPVEIVIQDQRVNISGKSKFFSVEVYRGYLYVYFGMRNSKTSRHMIKLVRSTVKLEIPDDTPTNLLRMIKIIHGIKKETPKIKKIQGEHKYVLIKGFYTIAEAHKKAKELGGYLAQITSRKELEYCMRLVDASLLKPDTKIWCGGRLDMKGNVSWDNLPEENLEDGFSPLVYRPDWYPCLTITSNDADGKIIQRYKGSRPTGCNASGKKLIIGILIEFDK